MRLASSAALLLPLILSCGSSRAPEAKASAPSQGMRVYLDQDGGFSAPSEPALPAPAESARSASEILDSPHGGRMVRLGDQHRHQVCVEVHDAEPEVRCERSSP